MEKTWVYCARGVISAALRIQSMGYHLHGHDINVEACICSERPKAIDLSTLKKYLEGILSKFDHKPLWEALGLEEAVMEDLVEAVGRELGDLLRLKGIGAHVCIVRASVPGESVEYRSWIQGL